MTALKDAIDGLGAQLDAIDNSSIMALSPYVTVQSTGLPKVVLSGINVQIVNGVGRTDSINGLGNLVIGYDKPHIESNLNLQRA